MTPQEEPISPGKKYALKMLSLMETDPQIAALLPSEEIGQAILEAPTLEAVYECVFTGYAERPALGAAPCQGPSPAQGCSLSS